MDLLLQVIGAVTYTLNKFCLAAAHGKHQRRWSMFGWLMLLVGMPAWVIILVKKGNWLVAALEAGGGPAMLLGLVDAYRQRAAGKSWRRGVDIFSYSMLVLGVNFSLNHFGGLVSSSQLLELGAMAGYLMGCNQLAQKKRGGWLWFMLMNVSMGTLMAVQQKPVLAIQQAVSLLFDIWGFAAWRTSNRLG